MQQEPHDPHGAEFDTASIQWGGAPISAVAMPAHMGLSADLVHALDYVVLIQVLFNVSSQTPSTPVTVWTQLKERGIRSAKNGKELVGRDAVYDAFKRLMGAGYVRRVELPNEKHPGRRGPIAYTVYDNPAWNPDWQVHQVGSEPLKKPQVGMLPGTPEAVKPDAASREAVAGESPQVRMLPAFREALRRPPHSPRRGWETHPPYPPRTARGGVGRRMRREGSSPNSTSRRRPRSWRPCPAFRGMRSDRSTPTSSLRCC